MTQDARNIVLFLKEERRKSKNPRHTRAIPSSNFFITKLDLYLSDENAFEERPFSVEA
jgi:hypothetical protein